LEMTLGGYVVENKGLRGLVRGVRTCTYYTTVTLRVQDGVIVEG